MPVVRPIQTNFTAGEVSPRMFGRVDVARYANGAAEMQNMVVQVQGGATRRAGTYFAGEAMVHDARPRLVRFEVSTLAAYVIEFGNYYVRFWRNRAPLTDGFGATVIIGSPWGTADLAELRFAQSADVLFVCHPNHAPRRLSRTSETTFVIDEVPVTGGPWAEENAGATTLTPSGATGTITVTASAAVFAADDVGRLLAIRDETGERSASTAYGAGTLMWANYNQTVRLYRVAQAGTTAAADPTTSLEPAWDKNAPNGESNTVRDGTAVLEYLGRGRAIWGWGRITGYTSATQVTVEVIGRMPATSASTRWKLGAWSAARGYPRCMTFHAGRTWWGGSIAQPQTVWASETGDFYSLATSEEDGTVLDTNGITYTLDDNEVNTIRWMSSFSRGLMIGCPSGEFVIGPANTNGALSPSNFQAFRRGDRGSSPDVAGVRVGAAVLFVSRSGRKVREFVYDFSTDGFTSSDQTVLSEHITGQGVVQMAHQEEPEGVLWLVREDGALLSLTYDREQEVRAWCRHGIGGQDARVESVAVVPNPYGTADDVYVAVARTIDGQTRRYIEWIGPPFDAARDGEHGGVFVDSALTYSGAPTTVVTGLAHLEGESVAICADGAARPVATVSGGGVTIAAPGAALIHVGLPYTSRVRTLRPELAFQNGSAQGRVKRVTEVFLRLLETGGGTVGRPDGDRERLFFRTPLDDMTRAVPLFTGDREVAFPAGYDRDGQIVIETDEPLPMTALSVTYEVQVND